MIDWFSKLDPADRTVLIFADVFLLWVLVCVAIVRAIPKSKDEEW